MEKFSDRVTMLPALSSDEIEKLQKKLPTPLPRDIVELLSFSAGFDLPPKLSARFEHSVGNVRFKGIVGFEFSEAFPFSVALLSNGSGDYWAVDVNARTGSWGAIFFASHDPPVIALQARDLGEFLFQLVAPEDFAAGDPVMHSLNDAVPHIWRDDPWLKSVDEARSISDTRLSEFAATLTSNFRIADLRDKEIGSGFSWGRAGADAEIRRAGTDLIFAVWPKGPKN